MPCFISPKSSSQHNISCLYRKEMLKMLLPFSAMCLYIFCMSMRIMKLGGWLCLFFCHTRGNFYDDEFHDSCFWEFYRKVMNEREKRKILLTPSHCWLTASCFTIPRPNASRFLCAENNRSSLRSSSVNEWQ